MLGLRRSGSLILGAILLAATLTRILWNNVPQYSPADEHVYADYTRFLVEHGWSKYPELVQRHIDNRANWDFPPPLRWGWFALTTATCRLAGHCDERVLAWLSALAGIALVLLVYRLAARAISREVGLVAAALAVSSPLQLALGRRALQDEALCVVILGALIFIIDILDDVNPVRRRYAAAIALLTLAFTIKETFFLFYPPLIFLFVLAVRRRGWRRADVALFALPPLLYALGMILSGRSFHHFFQLLSIVDNSVGAEYHTRYQNGPPHRIALDLFTLAPLVCLLAVAALAWLARATDEVQLGLQNLALLAVGLMMVIAFSPSKNLRYVASIDPLLRILAAWALVQLARGRAIALWGAVALNAAVELAIFQQVFIAALVYDPVSDNLLRALQVIP